MKSTKKEIKKRKNSIINYLKNKGQTSIEDIALYFSMSTLTIRRNIEEFKRKGIIEQNNGKLKLVDNPKTNFILNEFDKEKQLIQIKTASLIKENDIIFINNSYTALGCLKYVKNTTCTVITNNLNIVNLDLDPKINTLITGGELKEPRSSLIGDITKKNILSINATKCIIGVDGLDLDNGLSILDYNESSITECMIKSSVYDRIVVCTSNKINKTDGFFTGKIDSITKVVTDNRIDMLLVYELKNRGIEVLFSD